MKNIINLRDRKIETIGQEIGDAFTLMAKSHFASIEAVKDIVGLAQNNEVNERVIKLNEELKALELLYGNVGEGNND